jgi:hypothetical protein
VLERRERCRSLLGSVGAADIELVPKPGLYQGGLLKSLMIWAIPLSFLPDRLRDHLVVFIPLYCLSFHFIAMANTGITLSRGHGRVGRDTAAPAAGAVKATGSVPREL